MPATTVLWFLAGVTLRSLCLMGLALAAIHILRVRTAAARHALWTSAMAGMLLLAALSAAAPAIPLRILGATTVVAEDAATVTLPAAERMTLGGAPSTPSRRWPTAGEAAVVLYLLVAGVLLARLSVGYLFTRRLVKASTRTELGPEPVYETNWITVPMTVGWAHPKILLPEGWREWEREKLAAVMAHERMHVRRADWAIALASGVNRCVFWFHPLAWWMERHLGALAEQACDDAALLEMGEREPYAQALLDMAAAVKTAKGRLVWEAMAMAKASEVKMRIERILDESRQIPRGVSGWRWAALAACSLPLIYMTAVLEPAPAQAQPQRVGVAITDGQSDLAKLTTADVSRMEQSLVSNPDDLETRSRLIGYYFLNNIREPRLTHILWMVEHHPESTLSAVNSTGVSPSVNSLNSASDYQRVATAWQEQVAAHPKEPKVLANAAQFYAQRGGDLYEAERLLKQGGNASDLANFYGKVLAVSTDSTGTVHFPAVDGNESFASSVIGELESSNDVDLLFDAGQVLQSMPPNADAETQRVHAPKVELGKRLMAKAAELGGAKYAARIPVMRPTALKTESTQPVGPKPVDLAEAPQVLSKVDPQYNPLARQARIQGDMHLRVTIGTDGRVTDVQLQSGHPLMVENTLNAVKQWIFASAFQSGIAVPARFPLIVPFRLDGGNGPLAPPPPSAPVTPKSTGATGTETRPATPQRIRVGGNVQMASLIHRVEAVYPEQARTAGANGQPLEGTVKLSVVINNDGTVQSVSPLEGHPLLAAAAQAAVQQWTYRPTLLNGDPVQVATTVDISFTAN